MNFEKLALVSFCSTWGSKVRVGLRVACTMSLLATTATSSAQLHYCSACLHPSRSGGCSSVSEDQYFATVVERGCHVEDEFKLRFNEWKKGYDLKAAQERADQQRREAAVEKEVQRLGSHRAAEARRLVEMREAAEKARAGRQGFSPIATEKKADSRNCHMVTKSGPIKVPFNYGSRHAAESALRYDAGANCRSPIGNAAILSSLECNSTEGRGVISGRLQVFWRCSGSFQCSMPHEVCEGKSAQGSVQ